MLNKITLIFYSVLFINIFKLYRNLIRCISFKQKLNYFRTNLDLFFSKAQMWKVMKC